LFSHYAIRHDTLIRQRDIDYAAYAAMPRAYLLLATSWLFARHQLMSLHDYCRFDYQPFSFHRLIELLFSPPSQL